MKTPIDKMSGCHRMLGDQVCMRTHTRTKEFARRQFKIRFLQCIYYKVVAVACVCVPLCVCLYVCMPSFTCIYLSIYLSIYACVHMYK